MATRRSTNVDSRTGTNTSKASTRKAVALKQNVSNRRAAPLTSKASTQKMKPLTQKSTTRDSATKYASQKMHSMKKQDAFARQVSTTSSTKKKKTSK